MKRSLLLLSLLSCFTSAQAETLESNLTFQIKLTEKLPQKESGDFEVENYASYNLKNSDIIRRIAEKRELPEFSSKAQIIYQTAVTTEPIRVRIFIRDKGREDVVVTDMLEIINEFFIGTETESFTTSGKTSKKNGTGKTRTLGELTLNIRPDPDVIDIQAHGTSTTDNRIVASKERESVLNLALVKFSGIGSFNFGGGDNGVAQFSLKVAPPKVLPGLPADLE